MTMRKRLTPLRRLARAAATRRVLGLHSGIGAAARAGCFSRPRRRPPAAPRRHRRCSPVASNLLRRRSSSISPAIPPGRRRRRMARSLCILGRTTSAPRTVSRGQQMKARNIDVEFTPSATTWAAASSPIVTQSLAAISTPCCLSCTPSGILTVATFTEFAARGRHIGPQDRRQPHPLRGEPAGGQARGACGSAPSAAPADVVKERLPRGSSG